MTSRRKDAGCAWDWNLPREGWKPDLIQQEGGGNRSDLSPAVVQAPSPGVGGALERRDRAPHQRPLPLFIPVPQPHTTTPTTATATASSKTCPTGRLACVRPLQVGPVGPAQS